MADQITPEERAAIAAYTGPVTICPPRTFALDAGATISAADAIRLHYSEARARGASQSAKEGAARRGVILSLADGTRTREEVAALLSIGPGPLRRHVRRLEAAGYAPAFRPAVRQAAE